MSDPSPLAARLPKSFDCFRNYDSRTFTADAVAGITVGLVALPLAIAFAIASGVPPQAGIYCAIVAGFLISALGGSRTQIGGPTGAFVVVVSGIVAAHGLDGLFMCTMMGGVILLLLGLTGLGTAVDYIPRPVVIGFTNGIAVIIASTQLKEFFGLATGPDPGHFIERMVAVANAMGNIQWPTALLSAAALLVLIVMARRRTRVPGSIVVLVLGTAVAWVANLPVATVGSRFGDLPSGFPALTIPTFRPELVRELLSPALTVAMLGAIESLLSAVVADRMTGDRHNPNVELVAQGLANIASPLVGGLPATGAIARTATNIRSGARTPMAGMIHAATLLVIVLVGAPLARHIPLGVLGAILFVVAWNMGEWREVPEILRLAKADIAVWAITFGLTVFADLTVAVQAGMILAALFYIRKVAITTTVSRVTPDYIEKGVPHSLQMNPLPDGVAVYRIHGPFLFGATEKLSIIEEEMASLPPVVVLRLRNMTAIDATGVHALERLAGRLKSSGRHLLICGLRDQPARLMSRSQFHRHIDPADILPSLAGAADRARELLGRRAASC
ncbi:MAG TPA: SulP family inorganic anion transporter [Candidatus Eisenbacteria bacterium]